MLSANSMQNACPKHCHALLRHNLTRRLSQASVTHRRSFSRYLSASTQTLRTRPFSTSVSLRQEESTQTPTPPTAQDIERVVRDAKQRFRDTLPKDYLSDEEYAVYVRLYGPPLRETEPEDVGIHMHHDMGSSVPVERVAIKQLEDGSIEEITYEIKEGTHQVEMPEEDIEEIDPETIESILDSSAQIPIPHAPTYVESVARSEREAEALQKLTETFEKNERERIEAEDRLALEEAEQAHLEQVAESSWPQEKEYVLRPEERDPEDEPGAQHRFHPYTLSGSFNGNDGTIMLPIEQFVEPILDILKRSHIDHVKQAAEAAYGGSGLPLTAETVLRQKSGLMGPIGLLADQKHMTEVEADAFLAGFMPPVYPSVYASLREVRKRLGPEWIQSRLKSGGPGLSVLDAGSGGAGLIAWDQILNAEWELLKEKKQVRGSPPNKKTVIATSDRLRSRLKTFLHDTTFLPRLPDYEHSGEMRGPRLEGGDQQQPRKSYDLIIASHLFLREKETHRRQAVLNNLWHLLKKDGGVLIIIEKAHPRGFEAVAHARDTILNQFLLNQDGNSRIPPEEFNPTFHREPEPGRIIAPCTNQEICPMYPEPGKYTSRKDYCHFTQHFVRPNFYNKLLNKRVDNHGEVQFSYVAVQRGVTKTGGIRGDEATKLAKKGYEMSTTEPDMQTLPRLILPALKRKGHVTMDLCTPAGKIERWTVPKSFSKLAYHDARKSNWGDLWALGAKTATARNLSNGTVADGRSVAKPKIRKVDIDGDSDVVRISGGTTRDRKGKGKLKVKKKSLLEELKKAEQLEEQILEREMDEEIQAELEADEENEREEREKGRRRRV